MFSVESVPVLLHALGADAKAENEPATGNEVQIPCLGREYERGPPERVRGLRIDLSRVLGSSPDAAAALAVLSRTYCGFAFAHTALIDVLAAEAASLPEEQQRSTRQAIREYVGEWAHLLRATAGVPDVPARIRVIAALSMINDVARTPHLRVVAGIDDILEAAAAGLLMGTHPGRRAIVATGKESVIR